MPEAFQSIPVAMKGERERERTWCVSKVRSKGTVKVDCLVSCSQSHVKRRTCIAGGVRIAVPQPQ